MDIISSLPEELTPASDTWNTANVVGELCLKPPANLVRFFLREKPNDHSFLELHPVVKNLNVNIFRIAALHSLAI
jgi:hypothetical protein